MKLLLLFLLAFIIFTGFVLTKQWSKDPYITPIIKEQKVKIIKSNYDCPGDQCKNLDK